MNTYLPKILITGGQGQLASALKQDPNAKEFILQLCSRREIDITHIDSIDSALTKYKPDLIINTAAYTAVDNAEQDTQSALQVNHAGVKNLALCCNKNQLPLIHISTDYVFDGSKLSPYQENDQTNPINFYGKAKLLGEQEIINSLNQFIILRVSGIFSDYGQNFLKTILRLAQERNELRVVSDQITCPTYAHDIAKAIFTIAKKYFSHENCQWGIYHYCSAMPVSWYQFAVSILARCKQNKEFLTTEIQPIPTIEYPTPAKRPLNSVLACDKIFNHFSIAQPSWEFALDSIFARYS